MEQLKQANLVILGSVNGRDHWFPVPPAEVPEWVKNPDNMARMVNGEACMKCDEGDKGSLWYRIATDEDIPGLERVLAAKDKRDRRQQKRLRDFGNQQKRARLARRERVVH